MAIDAGGERGAGRGVSLALDHLVVAATSLEAGVSHVRETLGIDVPPGGAHDVMATHNHLMRLGDDVFLEIIAADRSRPAQRPRWYALDHFEGAPRLLTFAVRTTDLDAALRQLPAGLGEPVNVRRGDLAWRFAVPADGALPYGGAFPSLIEWPQGVRPWEGMAERGCALRSLTVSHPEAALIASALCGKLDDPRLDYAAGPAITLAALLDTPQGPRTLA